MFDTGESGGTDDSATDFTTIHLNLPPGCKMISLTKQRQVSLKYIGRPLCLCAKEGKSMCTLQYFFLEKLIGEGSTVQVWHVLATDPRLRGGEGDKVELCTVVAAL